MKKKLFTLMTLALTATLGVSAQKTYKWNFTKWSETTVENLKADAAADKTKGWSDVEDTSKNDGEPTEASKDNCFWAASLTKNEYDYLTANSEVIEELEGLKFLTNGNRALAIAVNYPTAQISGATQTYEGGAYLWLGSKEKDYFIIPSVKANTTIKMGVESHNNSDPRGVRLYISSDSNGKHGDELKKTDGGEITLPTTYTELEWNVGENDIDVVVYNTNGCHIYYIEATADIWVTQKNELKASIVKAENIIFSQALYVANESVFQTLKTGIETAKAALEKEESGEALIAAKTAMDKEVETAKKALETLEKKTFIYEAKYLVQETTSDIANSGETKDVELNDEVVATLTFGGSDDTHAFRKGIANTSAGDAFVAYTEGNGQNPDNSKTDPTTGTFYTITPSYDGNIEVGICLNVDKAFYVLEEGTALADFNGVKTTDKLYGTCAFDVKAGKAYKVFCSGSKLGFYGFYYRYNPTEVSIDITCKGGRASYTTPIALDFAESGAKAYIVTSADNAAAYLTEVTTVPAGEPIIVIADSEETASVSVAVAEDAEDVGENLLKAGEGETVADGAYALSTEDGLFHPVASTVAIPVGKAYLPASLFAADDVDASRGISLVIGNGDDDGTTSITGVEAKKFIENNKFYNLNGQEVLNPTKGLYIVNGKKVMIK